jgi:DNA topoisomerase-6 subunit A
MKKRICQQLKPGKKSERQAFAGKGLNYVTDVYLPERLGEMGVV